MHGPVPDAEAPPDVGLEVEVGVGLEGLVEQVHVADAVDEELAVVGPQVAVRDGDGNHGP
jgi:hypothetical protein